GRAARRFRDQSRRSHYSCNHTVRLSHQSRRPHHRAACARSGERGGERKVPLRVAGGGGIDRADRFLPADLRLWPRRANAAHRHLVRRIGEGAMDIIGNLWLGLQTAASLTNLLYCLIGVFLGTAIGVLPGLGPVATIAMLLPVTFGLPPISA